MSEALDRKILKKANDKYIIDLVADYNILYGYNDSIVLLEEMLRQILDQRDKDTGKPKGIIKAQFEPIDPPNDEPKEYEGR